MAKKIRLAPRGVVHQTKEKVLVIHEDEAAALYHCAFERLKAGTFNLNDEAHWAEVAHLKNLIGKLEAYLDRGEGSDVREVE